MGKYHWEKRNVTGHHGEAIQPSLVSSTSAEHITSTYHHHKQLLDSHSQAWLCRYLLTRDRNVCFLQVISIVSSGELRKGQFLAKASHHPGGGSSCDSVPEAFVLSFSDSLTIPSCQLHVVKNTGPWIEATRHRVSEAWGLRIMRSWSWSVAGFCSIKWEENN